MATTNFEELAKGLCELVGEAPPALAEEGLLGFSVTLNDVEVNIFHDPERNKDCAFVVTTFGALPEHGRLQSMQALMEANHRMSISGGGVFSQNYESGNILFQYAFPFDDAAMALDLYQGMQAVAEHVHAWRQNHLLAAPDDLTPQLAAGMRV